MARDKRRQPDLVRHLLGTGQLVGLRRRRRRRRLLLLLRRIKCHPLELLFLDVQRSLGLQWLQVALSPVVCEVFGTVRGGF
jgi:hypothetical protein